MLYKIEVEERGTVIVARLYRSRKLIDRWLPVIKSLYPAPFVVTGYQVEDSKWDKV